MNHLGTHEQEAEACSTNTPIRKEEQGHSETIANLTSARNYKVWGSRHIPATGWTGY